jgi:hypothetical protein
MRNLSSEFLNYAAINADFRDSAQVPMGLRTCIDADDAAVSRLTHSASPGGLGNSADQEEEERPPPPSPLPPTTRLEWPAIDYAALDAAMAHCDETA